LRTTAAAAASSWPARASVEPAGLHRLPRGRRNGAAVVAKQGAAGEVYPALRVDLLNHYRDLLANFSFVLNVAHVAGPDKTVTSGQQLDKHSEAG